MYFLDEHGLARYDQNIKRFISKRCNWQKSGVASTVAAYPIPETEMEPVVNFSFTETPPSEGNKAPDNPSSITGVSSASLWLAGKNVNRTMPYYNFVDGERIINGVTFRANADGSVTANGTATANANCDLYNSSNVLIHGTPIGIGTWRLSGCPSGGGSETYAIQPVISSGHGSVYYDYGSGSTITVTKHGAKIGLVLRVSSGYTAQNIVFKPQIELASEATAYEQPVEKQEYTIQLGDTYNGGSLDVATGVMTVTWAGKELTGTENWRLSSASTSEINEFYIGADSGFSPMTNAISNDTRSCSHFPLGNANVVADTFYTWGSAIRVIIRKRVSEIADVETFKFWLSAQYANGTPVTIVYKLLTPQTVQLDPVQIYSLSQTDKYTPRLNTIYTDANSVQVGYVKSPIHTEYELTQAIIATEGGV